MMLIHTKQTHIGTKRKQMNGQTLNRGRWVGIGLFSLAVFLGGVPGGKNRSGQESLLYEMRVVSWRQWCR
jgi:hypothetical protein